MRINRRELLKNAGLGVAVGLRRGQRRLFGQDLAQVGRFGRGRRSVGPAIKS